MRVASSYGSDCTPAGNNLNTTRHRPVDQLSDASLANPELVLYGLPQVVLCPHQMTPLRCVWKPTSMVIPVNLPGCSLKNQYNDA